MTKTGNVSLFTRFTAVLLALITVISVMPALTVEVDAADTTSMCAKYAYDFQDGTVGNAVSGTSVTVTAMTYAQDPNDATNIVASGSTGEMFLRDGANTLEKRRFVIEADIQIDTMAIGTLELFALEGKLTPNGKDTVLTPMLHAKKAADGDTTATVYMNTQTAGIQTTGKTVTIGQKHRIKLIVNEYKNRFYLYLDGTYVMTQKLPDMFTVKGIRVMSSALAWTGYVDNISYGICEYNEYISFDNFTAATPLTSANISALDTLTGKISVNAFDGYHNAVVDPKNSDNIVAYNQNQNESIFFLNDDAMELLTSDFVVSYDFYFEKFPTHSTKNLYFFTWIFSGYNTLCSINKDGYLVYNDETVSDYKFELKKWTNIMCHFESSAGKFDIYVNGEYIFSGTISGIANLTPRYSQLRILNKGQSNSFKVCVDNIMLYESERIEPTEHTVIWETDFEECTVDKSLRANDSAGVQNNMGSYSNVVDVYRHNSPWFGVIKAQGIDNKALKVDGTIETVMSSYFLDIYLGSETFDAFKSSKVALKLDFTPEEFDTKVPGNSDAGRRYHTLFDIMRLNAQGTAIRQRLLGFNYDQKLVFGGTPTELVLEAGKKYSIEVIFDASLCTSNKAYYTASLKVNGEVLVEGVYLRNLSAQGYDYFLDDAGIKRFVPYTGYVKSYVYDKNGEIVKGADETPVYVDKFVTMKNVWYDTARLFQGCNNSTVKYYVDNFKVEKIDAGDGLFAAVDADTVFATDFTGWEIDSNSATDDGSLSATDTDYRFSHTGNGMVKLIKEGNDTFVNFASAKNSQTSFQIGDREGKLLGKSIKLSATIDMVNEGTQDPYSFIAIVSHKNAVDNPFSGTGASYNQFVYADGAGNLYANENAITPIAALNIGGSTEIDFILIGDGTKWTEWEFYVDGKLVYRASRSLGGFASYNIRICNIKGTVTKLDDLSLRMYKENDDELKTLDMSFENETETKDEMYMLNWNYGILNSVREGLSGEQVTQLQILGESGSKYLHVNHEDVKSATNAYAEAKLSRFIDTDEYLIETAIRFTSTSEYGLNVAEMFDAEKQASAQLLAVKGTDNGLIITIRGVQYDVVTSSGTPFTVGAEGTDEEFTKIAILVDGKSNTYTLYINERLAYYSYADKFEPCANLPMHFIAESDTIAYDFIRLLEIPKYKQATASMDIDRIKLMPLYNTPGSTIKGTQTKLVYANNTYGVRFVSGIDTLYGTKVGFEISATYTENSASVTKTEEICSPIVFERIEADDKYVYASDLKCAYIATLEIMEIPMEQIAKFTVTPFVAYSNVKIYGEPYTVTFSAGELISE